MPLKVSFSYSKGKNEAYSTQETGKYYFNTIFSNFVRILRTCVTWLDNKLASQHNYCAQGSCDKLKPIILFLSWDDKCKLPAFDLFL